MPIPKVENSVLRLREHDFETGECEYCRYFEAPVNCKILVGLVNSEKVCDAFQGGKNFRKFHIGKEDIKAFGMGMKRTQPYKHIVLGILETPVGWLMILRDTMKPKPHRFSLDMPFSIEHLSREHHWTQKEVDRLIRIGRR